MCSKTTVIRISAIPITMCLVGDIRTENDAERQLRQRHALIVALYRTFGPAPATLKFSVDDDAVIATCENATAEAYATACLEFGPKEWFEAGMSVVWDFVHGSGYILKITKLPNWTPPKSHLTTGCCAFVA